MEELLTDLLERDESEKGGRGRVGVVGGSIEHAGPPAIAGEAALRTGSDLAKIVTSETVLAAVAGFSENLVVERYTGDHLAEGSVSKVTAVADWSDALVIGPGLGDADPEALRRIVEAASVPLVVDAGAILPVLESGPFPNAIFTPDAHEVDQITEHYDSLASFAERTGAVVVSTGATDEIVTGDDAWTNETGTPTMTVGGTGDTLAGVVASLLGQGLERTDAARLGTWLLGTAGERADAAFGMGMTATDVVESIPDAMLAHRDGAMAAD